MAAKSNQTYYKATLLVTVVHFRVCQVMAACIQWDLQRTLNRQGQTQGTTCTVAQPLRIITLWRAVPFAFWLGVIFYCSVINEWTGICIKQLKQLMFMYYKLVFPVTLWSLNVATSSVAAWANPMNAHIQSANVPDIVFHCVLYFCV